MTFHIVNLLLSGWVVAAVVMALLWVRQRATGNAGIIDVAWGAVIGGLGALILLAGGGDTTRRAMLGAMALLWGARLAWHIHRRSHGRPEDGRYTQLRAEWAPAVQWGIFRFYQYQAAAAAFFTLPFLAPSLNTSPGLSVLELVAVSLWAIGFAGETAADAQLERFKSGVGNRGRTCRDGLWNYSRHPNYFFEWLVWCGFALFAAASPGGWPALLCPLALLYVLLRVTGIPYAEQQAVRSRGEDYRRYQRTTSAFIPWFPRKDNEHVVRTAA